MKTYRSITPEKVTGGGYGKGKPTEWKKLTAQATCVSQNIVKLKWTLVYYQLTQNIRGDSFSVLFKNYS